MNSICIASSLAFESSRSEFRSLVLVLSENFDSCDISMPYEIKNYKRLLPEPYSGKSSTLFSYGLVMKNTMR
ncbi:Hypothetical predicted protein [Octopus vulgaris]|uniref:Uncharacterized protein n=1 Tax=Octopus vulgaris TaxID=6645 RepID=A0AA36AH93_OCTVU|nr:Hypothetical predicted protein [Octopus vulgaris]